MAKATSKIQHRVKPGHRAHKRDSVVIPSNEKTNHAARRKAKRADVNDRIYGLVKDAEANLDVLHEEAELEGLERSELLATMGTF